MRNISGSDAHQKQCIALFRVTAVENILLPVAALGFSRRWAWLGLSRFQRGLTAYGRLFNPFGVFFENLRGVGAMYVTW